MTKTECRWVLPVATGVVLVIALCHPGAATLTAVIVTAAAWAYAAGYRVTRRKEDQPIARQQPEL